MTNTLANYLITILLVMSTSFQACQKENLILTNNNKVFPGVDTELWVFFNQFEEASAKRGIPVDLVAAGITGSIENLNIDNIAGMCTRNIHHVTIDKTFWERSSSLRKELIVFHELGHCYLNLNHSDDAYPDGRCKSIMRSGMGACVDVYTYDSRKEYQDELFEER